MLSLPSAIRLFLCREATDLRKGFDTLAARVREVFGLDPLSGHLFLFPNRRRNRVKLLYWDRDGYAVWATQCPRDQDPEGLVPLAPLVWPGGDGLLRPDAGGTQGRSLPHRGALPWNGGRVSSLDDRSRAMRRPSTCGTSQRLLASLGGTLLGMFRDWNGQRCGCDTTSASFPQHRSRCRCRSQTTIASGRGANS